MILRVQRRKRCSGYREAQKLRLCLKYCIRLRKTGGNVGYLQKKKRKASTVKYQAWKNAV